jgi:hypothetical protein
MTIQEVRMIYNALYAVMTVVDTVESTGGLIVAFFLVATLAAMFDNAQKEF